MIQKIRRAGFPAKTRVRIQLSQSFPPKRDIPAPLPTHERHPGKRYNAFTYVRRLPLRADPHIRGASCRPMPAPSNSDPSQYGGPPSTAATGTGHKLPQAASLHRSCHPHYQPSSSILLFQTMGDDADSGDEFRFGQDTSSSDDDHDSLSLSSADDDGDGEDSTAASGDDDTTHSDDNDNDDYILSLDDENYNPNNADKIVATKKRKPIATAADSNSNKKSKKSRRSSSGVESSSSSPLPTSGAARPRVKTVEETYQKKTQLEHILLRPDTYIGSVEPLTQPMFVLDENDHGVERGPPRIIQREITYTPGFYKIFDEIVVNAADNKQRDPTNMDRMEIDFDTERGIISVMNNGKSIPVVKHKEHGCYVATLIFGHLLTVSLISRAFLLSRKIH